jgi:epoxyqueuosine reductase
MPLEKNPTDNLAPLTARIKAKAIELGFHKVGIASVEFAMSEAEQTTQTQLNHWLDQGFAADMAWMHHPKRQDIRQVMPGVQSVIAVALNYYTDHAQSDNHTHAKISRYGWGRDYHRIIHGRLKQLSRWLETQSPDTQTRYYADTGPVSDKFWAEQAGLGWRAKNSNVITREYGSWVFLGSVLTNLVLHPDKPHTNHCGTCTRCIEACPTAAIRVPGVVDANRCIAYHTIENRADTLPPAIAENLQGWVAGCDICQEVCPWNQRFAQETSISEFHPYPGNLNPTLDELKQISDEAWSQRFVASALRRIKPAQWRRNAQAAAQAAKAAAKAAASPIPDPHSP